MSIVLLAFALVTAAALTNAFNAGQQQFFEAPAAPQFGSPMRGHW
jgi:hypothetical protein